MRTPSSPTACLVATVILAAATAPGCRAIEISPTALREPGGRSADRAACLARWEVAVGLMNEFMVSPHRRTLPPGRFELRFDGVQFVTERGTWPIGVESTTWGDVVVATDFWAQEDESGFVVGAIDPPAGADPDPLVDHSFFRWKGDRWLAPVSIAELTLHETTHVVWRDGTVGPWATIVYYVVAAATLRASTHPAEDRPNATSEEFAWFLRARDPDSPEARAVAREAAEHVTSPRDHCLHGPFEWPCAPRPAPRAE